MNSSRTVTTWIMIALFVLAGASASTATIYWGAPTGITGSSDVITNGTLVYAYGLGFNTSTPDNTYTSATINGVTFTNVSASAAGFVGATDVQNYWPVIHGSGSSPFSSLSADYQNLLGNSSYGYGSATLTLTGLITGHDYQFQWWDNDSRAPGAFAQVSTIATAGNSVTLLPHSPTLGGEGTVGQYAIGTFTATGPTEVISFAESVFNQGFQINAYQLRALPEPSTVMLLGLGGLLLGKFRGRPARK